MKPKSCFLGTWHKITTRWILTIILIPSWPSGEAGISCGSSLVHDTVKIQHPYFQDKSSTVSFLCGLLFSHLFALTPNAEQTATSLSQILPGGSFILLFLLTFIFNEEAKLLRLRRISFMRLSWTDSIEFSLSSHCSQVCVHKGSFLLSISSRVLWLAD